MPDAQPVLTLLGGVRWRGIAVAGARAQVLLAALAAEPRGRSDEELVGRLWPEERPAHPAKALQVVVSRARAATSADAIVRTSVSAGYRLSLAVDEVDLWRWRTRHAAARAALGAGEVTRAAELTAGLDAPAEPGTDPEVAREVAELARSTRTVRGIALAALGEHVEAARLLTAAGPPADEDAADALLRSVAAAHGVPAALAEYERLRADVADRLGVDLAPRLQRLHAELLAADRPVRTGLRYDTTDLLGREDDLRELRAALRTSRLTTIVGPGGLGKTRLAHVLARETSRPVVHFIELVGVTSPDALVSEVGAAVGVRDSVTGRHALTREQRNDVRARTAVQLDQAPTLLVLDNCEHLVEAVADLVAFLVATTKDLCVLATSRSPLAIAAERVHDLRVLGEDDAIELFRRRAEAVRPGVTLPVETVREVVRRLDGLPLAVELAAARVRAMSVEDIRARLEDRFALLRGNDRSAPDRHRTLLAVIDWSWQLLAAPEQRALAALSVFADGFTLSAAESVLGADGFAAVESLVAQSLLRVEDGGGSVRYRMLETVREFGRLRLGSAHEAAVAAYREWATEYGKAARLRLLTVDQMAAIADVRAEENNLADVLRLALAASDREGAAVLVACLGAFWSLLGEHARVVAVCDAAERALAGWEPGPDLLDVARSAAGVMLGNLFITSGRRSKISGELLERLGPESPDPQLRADTMVLLAADPDDLDGTVARLRALGRSPDRLIRMRAHQFEGFTHENAGNPDEALRLAEAALALVRPEDPPTVGAMLQAMAAQMHSQRGEIEQARGYARAALPVLDAIGSDDAIQVRGLLVTAALSCGEIDEAQRVLDEVSALGAIRPGFGSGLVLASARAELALVAGRHSEGLRLYRAALAETRALRFPGLGEPSGLEPWTVFGEAVLVAACARFSADTGADVAAELAKRVPALVAQEVPQLDLPVVGLVTFALGTWMLHREVGDPAVACRLLVLAERFAYGRFLPTLAWAPAAEIAEARAAGGLAAARREFGERRGLGLLGDIRPFLRDVARSWLSEPGGTT